MGSYVIRRVNQCLLFCGELVLEINIRKGTWKTLLENENRVVRSRPVFSNTVPSPIAEEFRLDQQKSDSWVEWVNLSSSYYSYVTIRRKLSEPKKPRNTKRDASGKFV